jgi:hypothetical protein
MNYIGIDIHKRYSVCATQDEQSRRLRLSVFVRKLFFLRTKLLWRETVASTVGKQSPPKSITFRTPTLNPEEA